MKERPILFNAAMVRAILDGRKTQTRRVVKRCGLWESTGGQGMRPMPEACPIAQPGDRIWVRETFASTVVAGQPITVYRESDNRTDYGGPWKPAIHMPRWASRITLEVVSVRVERLNEISPGDCAYEGVDVPLDLHGSDIEGQQELVGKFKRLWESINGPGSWAENPWMWVVEFRREG